MIKTITIETSDIERFETNSAVFGARAMDIRQTHSNWTFGMPLREVQWKSDTARKAHDFSLTVADQFSHVADRLRNFGPISYEYETAGGCHAQA